MTAIVLVLTALAVALTLGLLAREDPGYVLISRWPYEIEVSLALSSRDWQSDSLPFIS